MFLWSFFHSWFVCFGLVDGGVIPLNSEYGGPETIVTAQMKETKSHIKYLYCFNVIPKPIRIKSRAYPGGVAFRYCGGGRFFSKVKGNPKKIYPVVLYCAPLCIFVVACLSCGTRA